VTTATRERLFGYQHAFDHPVTVGIVAGLAVVLVVVPLLILLLAGRGKLGPAQRTELFRRYLSWLIIIPLLAVPILLGAAWTIGMVAVLSLLCYREYARAIGQYRDIAITLVVAFGILALTFAEADNWYHLFVAVTPLTVATIAAVAILADQPKGYIQRVSLAVLGFLLFGTALGHLGFMANDPSYRPVVLLLLLCVEANDVFAYVCGKTFGRRKLAPNTSPNKTVGGALGALVLTTALAAGLGHYAFRDTDLDTPVRLVLLGLIVSAAGQLGDLMLSSVKRDLGIKDMAATIPGHGGLLDRFDSLILVAPAVFHYVNYVVGFGPAEPMRIFTGG
jgi:phosphatidate cytidylyltransferase